MVGGGAVVPTVVSGPDTGLRVLAPAAEARAIDDDRRDALARRGTHWLGVVLALASTAGIVLALLGYGVALAVQGTLGVPHATLFSSTIDLFNLGGWAVAQVFSGTSQPGTWSFVAEVWQRLSPMIGRIWNTSLFVVPLFFGFVALRWGTTRAMKSASAQRIRSELRKSTDSRTWFKALLMYSAFVALITLAAPALVIFGFALLVVLSTALALAPIAGLSAGEVHIRNWVVEPKVCISRQQRIDTLMRPPEAKVVGKRARGADCVAVIRGDGKIEKGRLVFATTGAVVLYDPTGNSVRRVPTEGAVVEAIDSL